MFKKICLSICCLSMALSLCSPLALASYSVEGIANGEITTRAEQTEWCFCVIDGELYMRLWSITNNCWLTDWILC